MKFRPLSRINSSILFFILLLAVFFFIDFYKIVLYNPQGIHFMRQTDSLSFVSFYLKNKFNFFEPGVLNLDNGTGKSACEFPIIYYIAALLTYLFGNASIILKTIDIAIVSIGTFFLFRLIRSFLQSSLYGFAFAFLFISSTVLLYYTNNYIPDPPALGLTLIGWYYFYLFFEKEREKNNLFLAYLFFTLASLIKVTFFINPLSTIFAFVLYNIIYYKKAILTLFKENQKIFIFFSISFVLVLGWNLYVVHYNNVNNAKNFLTTFRPIWHLNHNNIAEVWDYITNYWYTKYYFQSTFHTFWILFLLGVIFIKNSNKKILHITIFVLIGTLCYFILFYSQFKDHDYYFIAIMPAFIFLSINSIRALQNNFPKLFNHISTKLVVIIIAILSLNYAKGKLHQRYELRGDIYAVTGELFYNSENYIDSLGIKPDAKVIVLKDLTSNGSLYFLNRSGWTIKDTTQQEITKLNYIMDHYHPNYIILTNKDFISQPSVNKIIGNLVGEYNDLLIYDIKNKS